MGEKSTTIPARDALASLDWIERWPTDQPLVMLASSGGDPRWSRWSIAATVEDWLIADPDDPDPLATLERAIASKRRTLPTNESRFRSGWIGFLSYDLGRAIEPTTDGGHAAIDRVWPAYCFARCERLIARDHVTATNADFAGRVGAVTTNGTTEGDATFTVGSISSTLTSSAYQTAVQRALDAIAAGDAFQVNVTQRLSTPFEGSTRALARRALEGAGAWYGAVLETPVGTIISMSPELFLDVDPVTRRVCTRPIKGTRPHSAKREQLRDSVKDAAELHMIVDLMRNDLGRVCTYGSVVVDDPRAIETHAHVHHGVGAVSGTLRDDVGPAKLLAATFPPGSVTGAPKIRAMQLIDDLEPVRRGPYCGAIGFFGDDGTTCLSVAIRTIGIAGPPVGDRWDQRIGTLDYGAGGGVVADSEPLSEYRESLDKSRVLTSALGNPAIASSGDERVGIDRLVERDRDLVNRPAHETA